MYAYAVANLPNQWYIGVKHTKRVSYQQIINEEIQDRVMLA